MNHLERRLAFLRLQLRFTAVWRGLAALIACIGGGAVLIALVDRAFALPALVRAACLLGLLLTTAVVAYRFLLQPLLSRWDDLTLALKIEEAYPHLNDSLASAVQFLDTSGESGASVQLRGVATEKAMQDSGDLPFGVILDLKSAMWISIAAFTVLLTIGHFAYRHNELSEIAFLRLADPYGLHPWTRIAIEDAPHRVALNQRYPLRGAVQGVVPKRAHLEVQGQGYADAQVAVEDGSFVTSLDMTRQIGKFRFRIAAGDGSFPSEPGTWHEVEVLPAPKLVALGGLPSPQVELTFPAYTGMPQPVRLTPGMGQLESVMETPIVFGTKVVLRAAADRPLQKAWIQIEPENITLANAALMAHLGQGPVPAQFEDEKQTVFKVEFTPWTAGEYQLLLQDADGLLTVYRYDLRMKHDPVPIVVLQSPASSIDAVPDARISITIKAQDEFFGLRSVAYRYIVKDAEGRTVDEVAPPGMGVERPSPKPADDPRDGGGWLYEGPPATWGKRPEFETSTSLSLDNRVAVGNTIVLEAIARDFCDIYLMRELGRSQSVEIHVISKEQLAQKLDEGLAKARLDLVRLQKLQDDALNAVKNIEQAAAPKTPKEEEKKLDSLIDAQELQKRILERIGAQSDEGMRKELADRQQSIQDNKLPSSESQNLLRMLKSELDRLAQSDLPRIGSALAEAQKETTAKSGVDKKGALAKTEQMQKEAKKSLDELGKLLDPWASMQLVKGKTQELIKRQRDLNDETDKLLEREPDQGAGQDADFKADLKRKAEEQKALGDAARKLMDMANAAKDKRAEASDDDNAHKLADAIKAGELLPKTMREAGDKLERAQLHAGAQQQQDNLKQLEKMQAALEGQKDDDLEKLEKKQTQVTKEQDDVEKLADKQERLQKKVQQAQDLADPEERVARLKELAAEQEQLKDEAKEEARELARLQEDRASKALDRAAEQMDKAAQQLNQGESPEDAQNDALDRLNAAEVKLDDTREELAREQLAKIADRIKGLAERQAAAVDRSKQLHSKVMEHKKWSHDQIDTLDADRVSQEGLSKEADSLREKLKNAIVFEHIIDNAVKEMQKAAAAMMGRSANARDRQLDEMEKEEIADEMKAQTEIVNHQMQAGQRLERLIEALKNDPMLAKNKPNDNAGNDGGAGGQGDKKQGGIPASDGIPETAQLKALRGEQVDINDKTKTFAESHPDVARLTDSERDELAAIQAEQARLHELFARMTAAAGAKGTE